MTTHDEPLTPDEDAVRRTLAAARHTDPLPEATASRLDAALAELVVERFGGDPTTTPDGAPAEAPTGATLALGLGDTGPGDTVVPLRRRPRRLGALVAAAAVVVACLSAPAWWTSSQNDMSTSGQSTESLEQESDGAADSAAPAAPLRPEVPALTSERTTPAHARALVSRTARQDTSSQSAPPRVPSLGAPARIPSACAEPAPPGVSVTVSIQVTWDGQPARLVETVDGALLVLDCRAQVLHRF